MTTIRKLFALLLVLAMVLAGTGTIFAADYSDLETHWSKPYMEELVERKFLSGYSDGTMQPDKDITAGETFVVLSRFYALNETETDAVWDDYGDAAEAITATKWVRPYVAVALAAGITTYEEAKTLDMNKALPKEQLAAFLVRAMQMEDTARALEETELPFTDKDSVSAAYKGSVALLSQLKIVSGNTIGEFCPQSNVTRAVAATMVCKVLEYLEQEDITLKLTGYTGLSLAEGVLYEISDKGLVLRDFTGIYRFYPRAAVFTAAVNGKNIVLNDDYEGCYANLRLMEGKVISASVTDPENEVWKQGTLRIASVKATTISVYNLEDDEYDTYDVSQAAVYINGEEDELSGLKSGYFVSLKDTGKRVKEVRAFTKDVTIRGTITAISYGTSTVISMDVEDDCGVELRLAIYSLPVIKRGSLKVSVDKLVVGDAIEAEFTGGEVDSITVKVNTVSGRGTIKSVLTSADGTGWVLTLEDGSEVTYNLAKNVVGYEGKVTIDLSSLTYGDEVAFVVQDGAIISVTLEKAHTGTTAQSADLSLEVLYVNTKDKTVACMDENKNLVYLLCIGTRVIESSSGQDLSLSALDAGDRILVWGTYNKDAQLAASTIIITFRK